MTKIEKLEILRNYCRFRSPEERENNLGLVKCQNPEAFGKGNSGWVACDSKNCPILIKLSKR